MTASPFKQAYIVTTDTGTIYWVGLEASSFALGRVQAIREVESFGEDAWDTCAYPVTSESTIGVEVLARPVKEERQ